MQQITLSDMLANEVKTNGLDEKLARLIETVAACGVEISSEVACGALMGVLGMAGSENVQGEEQKKLDVISNDIVTKAVLESGVVAACASEEMDHCVAADCTDRRPYLICYDPLDGSSNIDINVSIGTIFSILPNPHEDATAPQDADFLQPGDRQLAAGYIMYGPQTQMALTLGRGVVMFTLDPRTNTYILTNDNVQVPEQAKEFAINCSNKRHWEAPVNRYIEELLAGKTGRSRQGLQHALGGGYGCRSTPHPLPRRNLHVPQGQPRSLQTRQASSDVRSQSHVLVDGTGRRPRHQRLRTHSFDQARKTASARGCFPRCQRRS